MCWLFVYLHFIDCVHVLLSTLRLTLGFVPAKHRQLSLPSSAWKSLGKVVVYKTASGEEQNSCKPTGLWLELVPSQYWTSSVIGGGPITEDEGNLTVQNPSGRQPFHGASVLCPTELWSLFFCPAESWSLCSLLCWVKEQWNLCTANS